MTVEHDSYHQHGEHRAAKELGTSTPSPSSVPTWALSPVSDARKLASQEGHHHGPVKRLLLRWHQSKLFSAVGEAQPWRHPHQRGPEAALNARPLLPASPPPPPPRDTAPPSPGAPFPLGSGCVPTQHHLVKPPVNPLLVPAPRYHQLPAPWSGAAIKLAPLGLHQEPFLIHSPEAKHREPGTHLPGWAPSGSSHPGETETCCCSVCSGERGHPVPGWRRVPPAPPWVLATQVGSTVTSHQRATPKSQSGPFLEVREESSEPLGDSPALR